MSNQQSLPGRGRGLELLDALEHVVQRLARRLLAVDARAGTRRANSGNSTSSTSSAATIGGFGGGIGGGRRAPPIRVSGCRRALIRAPCVVVGARRSRLSAAPRRQRRAGVASAAAAGVASAEAAEA